MKFEKKEENFDKTSLNKKTEGVNGNLINIFTIITD